jgi:large subunit ribosomal protein L3
LASPGGYRRHNAVAVEHLTDMNGILGKKIGMTQIFTPEGVKISVTAIEAGPCAVLSIKEKSVQLGFEATKEKNMLKPVLGLFKKHNISPRKFIREVPRDTAKEYKIGDELTLDIFTEGSFVDVTGISRGKGFQGGMKRWHWAGGPGTHGHTTHRRVGSIGSSTSPGRVFRGHHMPGHMGHKGVTEQNLKVIKIDVEKNILLVKGAVPGPRNTYLVIRSAIKKQKKQK